MSASSIKLSLRWARRVFVILQVIASLIAITLVIPMMIISLAFYAVPGRDYTPFELFHTLRRFFFRLLAGRTLRPFTLRAALPRGPSIRATSDTTI